MWKVEAVAQGTCEVSEKGVEGPEPVPGDGVHDAFKVPVTVAVESDFFRFLLQAESLEGANPTEAAVGAVGRTRREPPSRPSTSVALVKMLQLHLGLNLDR